MLKTKPIRDPVYDYIQITPIEQTIIDRPEFQRLRFVLQNSSAYLTYPSNFSTRFLHSLGVMHLSGEMFTRALEAASADVLKGYLTGVAQLVGGFEGQMQASVQDFMDGWRSLLGHGSRFNHRPPDGRRADLGDAEFFYINLLWQSVRLCALIHDIGHLPMSHLFEFAVEDFLADYSKDDSEVKQEYFARRDRFFDNLEDGTRQEFFSGSGPDLKLDRIPLHEWWGLALFGRLYPHGRMSAAEDLFCRLVYRLAKLIFLLNRPPGFGPVADKYAPLRCLHTVVSSSLDADRLDYCIRDPRSSGVEFDAIDIRRLVDSLVLYRDGAHFRILPTDKGLSALESFFHQRYLMYKYLIYHHNVVRMDEIVKEILIAFLVEADQPTRDSGLSDLLDGFGFWTKKPQRETFRFFARAGFEHYDDTWLRSLMADAYELLSAESRDGKQQPRHMARLLLLDTFLYRKTDNVLSLWKRDSDFQRSVSEVAGRLGLSGGPAEQRITETLGQAARLQALVSDVVEPLREELARDGVSVLYRYLAPKTLDTTEVGPKSLQVLVDGTPTEIARVSPYLSSLQTAARLSPNIHFSFVAKGIKGNKDLEDRCREATMDRLSQYTASILAPRSDNPQGS